MGGAKGGWALAARSVQCSFHFHASSVSVMDGMKMKWSVPLPLTPLIDAADGCPRARCTWPRAAAIPATFRDEAAGVAPGCDGDARHVRQAFGLQQVPKIMWYQPQQ